MVSGIHFKMGQVLTEDFEKIVKELEDKKNVEIIKPEEKINVDKTDKSFTGELRGLLNDYPKELNLVNSFDFLEIAKNFIIILDSLTYCKSKTTKEEIRNKIIEEIELFKKIDINKLRILLGEYAGCYSEYIKSKYVEQIKEIILPYISLVSEKVQFFFNCMPSKGKPYKHYRNAQGFPAHTAEEYESPEIEAGEKIKEGQQFKIEEGVVIPI